MKRRDFQDLAALRLKEARILLQRRCWDGAYYLAGYAAECAIKACIAKPTERHEFPDREKTYGSYTHDLLKLAKTAGLDKELARLEIEHPALAKNWLIVRNWSARSRYELQSQGDAEELIVALGDRRAGLIRWLKNYW